MDRLCKIRDIQRAVHHYEEQFIEEYGICLNEGMVLCSMCCREQQCGKGPVSLSSGEISHLMGLTPSNTSKVIASLERKGYLKRGIGEGDKRQMFFTMTEAGRKILKQIRKDELEVPESLRSLVD